MSEVSGTWRVALVCTGICCRGRKVIPVEDWIFAENVQPFVELLAFLAGYTLYDDAYDWVAIEHGVNASFLKPGTVVTFQTPLGVGRAAPIDSWGLGAIITPTSVELQTIMEGAQW